jgi:transcriptional regulator with XRE-family HTH domain
VDPLTKRFAVHLKALRAKKNISQGVLAKKAGVSVSYISMLERAQRSPPLVTLDAIAKALGIHPAYFLSGK